MMINDVIHIKNKDQIKEYIRIGKFLAPIIKDIYLSKENIYCKYKKLYNYINPFDPKTYDVYDDDTPFQFIFSEIENKQKERFNHSYCVSINDEVAHGFHMSSDYKDDIISLDFGLKEKNSKLIFDFAFTYQISEKDKDFYIKPLEALKAIKDYYNQCIVSKIKKKMTLSSLSRIITQVAQENSLAQVLDVSGHGIGLNLHEAPIIYNHEKSYNFLNDYPLLNGMVFCIEPVYTKQYNHSYIERVYLDSDNWTLKTINNVNATHFETMFVIKDDQMIDLLGITDWL